MTSSRSPGWIVAGLAAASLASAGMLRSAAAQDASEPPALTAFALFQRAMHHEPIAVLLRPAAAPRSFEVADSFVRGGCHGDTAAIAFADRRPEARRVTLVGRLQPTRVVELSERARLGIGYEADQWSEWWDTALLPPSVGGRAHFALDGAHAGIEVLERSEVNQIDQRSAPVCAGRAVDATAIVGHEHYGALLHCLPDDLIVISHWDNDAAPPRTWPTTVVLDGAHVAGRFRGSFVAALRDGTARWIVTTQDVLQHRLEVHCL